MDHKPLRVRVQARFDLFGAAGKAVLVLLLVAGGLGAGVLKQQVIDPQLQREASEKAAAVAEK